MDAPVCQVHLRLFCLKIDMPKIRSVLLNGVVNGMEFRLTRPIGAAIVGEDANLKRACFTRKSNVPTSDNNHQIRPSNVDDLWRIGRWWIDKART